MKYNIMVVLNSSYFNFGKVFMNSLYDNTNIDNINTIFIIDTGLSESDKEYFKTFNKVHIHDTGMKTSFDDGGTFGNGWQQSVGSKTIIMKNLLNQTDIPLVMIDGDCIFVKDFAHLIDDSYDIQPCYRPKHGVPYIASFVIAHNTKNCITFLDRWIALIEEKSMNVPRESPSLGEAVLELKGKIKIGNVCEFKVNTCNELVDDTLIIHLKGSSISRDIKEREQKSLIGAPAPFLEFIKKYSI